jgi:hypothetical protein
MLSAVKQQEFGDLKKYQVLFWKRKCWLSGWPSIKFIAKHFSQTGPFESYIRSPPIRLGLVQHLNGKEYYEITGALVQIFIGLDGGYNGFTYPHLHYPIYLDKHTIKHTLHWYFHAYFVFWFIGWVSTAAAFFKKSFIVNHS